MKTKLPDQHERVYKLSLVLDHQTLHDRVRIFPRFQFRSRKS